MQYIYRRPHITYVKYEIEQEGHHAGDVIERLEVTWLNLLQCVRIMVHLLSTRRDLEHGRFQEGELFLWAGSSAKNRFNFYNRSSVWPN